MQGSVDCRLRPATDDPQWLIMRGQICTDIRALLLEVASIKEQHDLGSRTGRSLSFNFNPIYAVVRRGRPEQP